MNLRVRFISALCCRTLAAAIARRRKPASVKRSWSRTKWSASAATSTIPISVGDGVVRDETVRTGADSAARLVMADSTNLSLGPSATLTLDRTVFNDEHSYREIAIRMRHRRIPLRHRTFGQDRLQDQHAARNHRRARHHPRYPVATRPDHRGAAGRRGQRLHADLPVHPADAAWRHRYHHVDRRRVTDHEDQHAALEFRSDLRRGSGALHRHQYADASPAPPVVTDSHRHAVRSLTMAKLLRTRLLDRPPAPARGPYVVALACCRPAAVHLRGRVRGPTPRIHIARHIRRPAVPHADVTSRRVPDVQSAPSPTADALTTPDRRRFQRRLDRRPRQSALQPDDHQPRARHGAARRQRTGQLQRLRQRVRLGRLVLGRHSRPQGDHAQSVAAGRASPTRNTARAATTSPARRSARSRCATISSTGDRRGRSSTSAPS